MGRRTWPPAGVWRVRSIDDESGRLVLRERNGIFELVSGRVILLSSAALETERAFGRLAADPRPPRPLGALRVLIGGLGFGATLRSALDALGPRSQVVVAEKVAGVGRLVRGELADVSAHALADPRVSLVVDDVADVIARASGEFDAILLDVDNGPHWASFRANARLYTPAGLLAARRALAPGGLLAVWSGYAADGFLARLREAGLAPAAVPLHERGRVRARAYVGTKSAP